MSLDEEKEDYVEVDSCSYLTAIFNEFKDYTSSLFTTTNNDVDLSSSSNSNEEDQEHEFDIHDIE